MAPQVHSLDRVAEKQFVETLRTRYENAGFTFMADPDADQLPDFLGTYRPDAVVRKSGQNVAIAVRRGPGPSEPSLQVMRQMIEGHPDWRLHVAFMGSDPRRTTAIPRADPAEIRAQAAGIRALNAAGHHRPAFVMAWSLLEAVLRARSDEADLANPPGSVVQALAMNGLIDPEAERALRALIDLRDRIVHGDLAAEPAEGDVGLVLAAVEAALSEEDSRP